MVKREEEVEECAQVKQVSASWYTTALWLSITLVLIAFILWQANTIDALRSKVAQKNVLLERFVVLTA